MKNWGYLIIIALSIICYSNTFNHSYAHDDAIVITHNDKVKKGIKGIPLLFKNKKTLDIQDRYGYRPITLMGFAIEYDLFKNNPKAYHISNVILYTLLCCLIYYLLLLLFKEHSYLLAFLTTILFIVHPIHTEVVANIKSRDELLMMLFGIIACIYFLKGMSSNSSKKTILLYTISIISCVLSFLSRENGIVFIGILFLINLYYRNFKLKLNKSSLIIGISLICILFIRWFYTSEYFFEDNSIELSRQGLYYEDGFLGNPLLGDKDWSIRVSNCFYILISYLKLLLWPNHLVHDYGYGYSKIIRWDSITVWASIVIHLGLITIAILKRKTKSPITFGILFYFISISIFLHIIQITPDYMAERYLFVPSLGFCIVIAFLLLKLFEKIKNYSVQKTLKISIAIFVFSILIGLSIKTIKRNKVWKDTETLYNADIDLLRYNARANYNYALMLEDKYKDNQPKEIQDKILQHMEQSLSVSNRSLNIRLGYALKLIEVKQKKKAIPVLKSISNDFPYNILATQYLSTIYIEEEKFQEALKVLNKKETYNIKNVDIMYLKAICLIKVGEIEEAYRVLKNAIDLFPNNENINDLKLKFNI